jgi:hypothetical protein
MISLHCRNSCFEGKVKKRQQECRKRIILVPDSCADALKNPSSGPICPDFGASDQFAAVLFAVAALTNGAEDTSFTTWLIYKRHLRRLLPPSVPPVVSIPRYQ